MNFFPRKTDPAERNAMEEPVQVQEGKMALIFFPTNSPFHSSSVLFQA
jgi:hypothetical protein